MGVAKEEKGIGHSPENIQPNSRGISGCVFTPTILLSDCRRVSCMGAGAAAIAKQPLAFIVPVVPLVVPEVAM